MDLPSRDRIDDQTFLGRVAGLVPSIRAHAALLDHDGAFPAEDLETLAGVGALTAALPPAFGGHGLGTVPDGALTLASFLGLVGSASLPLGRILEGHVNALALVFRYASPVQQARAAADTRAGALFGVWNTDDQADPLTVADGRLSGRKILCSGAGHVTRALVPGFHPDGRRMLLVPLDDPARVDLSPWTAQGMRASATGHVDFAGIAFTADMLIGHPGDYERQPVFSGGAWRVLAVFAGGIDALADALSAHLADTGRDADPHQLARAGQLFIARETVRLWVREAAQRVEAADPDPDATVAYVNLARGAVEAAAVETITLVQRSVGLTAFLRPHPIERVCRDLATYLRQPVPDRALTAGAAHFLRPGQILRA